ncbi:N-acetylglucosaminyltransferase [Acrasis kona]|uniref:N-acetylglucosaminyltransferase n=1 Tax=Acrasis kona TaxID=1008807 RepID=A0AAW2YNS6_9EUKA
MLIKRSFTKEIIIFALVGATLLYIYNYYSLPFEGIREHISSHGSQNYRRSHDVCIPETFESTITIINGKERLAPQNAFIFPPLSEDLKCLPLKDGKLTNTFMSSSSFGLIPPKSSEWNETVHEVAMYVAKKDTLRSMTRPTMQPESDKLMCERKDATKEFARFLCDADMNDEEPHKFTYLTHHAGSRIWLSYIDCGYADFGSNQPICTQALYNEKGHITQQTSNIREGEPIIDYEQLGVIPVVCYSEAYGHWPTEIIHKLIFMWNTLPKGVPLLVPKGTYPHFQLLLDEGVLDRSCREAIKQNDTTSRARRMWFLKPEDEKPIAAISAHNHFVYRYARQVYRDYLSKRANHNENTIVIIRRPNTRAFKNFDEIHKAISDKYSSKYKIIVFQPKGSFLDQGMVFYNAKLVVAAHGAGLSNQMFMQEGSSLIEIGPLSTDMPLPSMYYGIAQALKIKYHLMLTPGQIYGGDLSPDIDEVMRNVEASLKN